MTSTLTRENNFLAVATVLKPQGINGEVKVLPLLDNPEDLLNIKSFFINNSQTTVNAIRLNGGFAFLKLSTVTDRDKAEALRGKELFTKKEELPALQEGRFYISDLIGSEIFDENGKIGSLSNILQHGSADVYEVRCKIEDGSRAFKSFMFPALKSVIINTDIENKKILVNGEELRKVAVYED